MFDRLLQHIESVSSCKLSPEEADIIQQAFIPKSMRRKQYLLHEGAVCKYMTFVNRGALRIYSIDNKGDEHIVRFALEGWWMCDRESFSLFTPSRYNIDAIEDCDLLVSTNEQLNRMKRMSPAFVRFTSILDDRHYAATHKRIQASISYTAEEKVLDLMNTYPDFLRRLPLNMIASYLGLSPETLSRVRRQLFAK